jgi:hypothetical protein
MLPDHAEHTAAARALGRSPVGDPLRLTHVELSTGPRIHYAEYGPWGDHDALFSREEQDHFRAALPGTRIELYEDTGHCPNWERPERVAADAAAFGLPM